MAPLLAGRFQIDRELGRGASSLVFAATDTWLDRAVALKVLATPEPAQRTLLAREWALLSRLAHHNIPRAFALARLGRGHAVKEAAADALVLVEELCEGEQAAAWAAGRPPSDIA